MKIALVHDYIKEYGGAERVLEELHNLYPDAPIYTAFYEKHSHAYEHFKDAKIISSWAQRVPFFKSKLHSPLRFLTPLIWGSFDFSRFDVVITSASWYVTKGMKKGKNPSTSSGQAQKPIEICYCHTPPRWLYGYNTSIEWQKYWPIRLYGKIVGYFMRRYDYNQAQKVDIFIANSEEVKSRIKKFYNKDARIIYPPVSLPQVPEVAREDFYLVVARIVGAKGLSMAVGAAKKLGFKLKIVGAPTGYYTEYKSLSRDASSHVEFLGYVSDEDLATLYKKAKAFLALSKDEDFGITPVESMLSGTPVVAYYGGGYKETVIDDKTGVFFHDYSVQGLIGAIRQLEKLKINPEDCKKQAEKFSKKIFDEKIQKIVQGETI